MAENTIPPAAMESRLRAQLAANANDFPALVQLAALLLPTDRHGEGMALVDRAIALNPGHAAPFSLKATAAFRRHFGQPPARAAAERWGTVSMRLLGRNGRFGNQLLQYGFLRLYAAAHGLSAQTPDWIGRDLFALNDPLADAFLPAIDESSADMLASLAGRGPVFANRDLTGYFCHHTSGWDGRAAQFRALYRPAAMLAPILNRAITFLSERGRTLVAIHIRRGDFGYGPFWIAPTAWYLDWLDTIWNGLDAPVLYIASDDPLAVAEFAHFGALGAGDLGVSIPGAEFYLDHYILSQARHLAISNSSFSFTASMLNEMGGSFVRPDADCRSLIAYEPWNADVLLKAASRS